MLRVKRVVTIRVEEVLQWICTPLVIVSDRGLIYERPCQLKLFGQLAISDRFTPQLQIVPVGFCVIYVP